MNKPSMAQFAFINSLYEELGIPYSEREKPQDMAAARSLITHLLEMVDNKKNETGED
jgi:hypothetical protein